MPESLTRYRVCRSRMATFYWFGRGTFRHDYCFRGERYWHVRWQRLALAIRIPWVG